MKRITVYQEPKAAFWGSEFHLGGGGQCVVSIETFRAGQLRFRLKIPAAEKNSACIPTLCIQVQPVLLLFQTKSFYINPPAQPPKPLPPTDFPPNPVYTPSPLPQPTFTSSAKNPGNIASVVAYTRNIAHTSRHLSFQMSISVGGGTYGGSSDTDSARTAGGRLMALAVRSMAETMLWGRVTEKGRSRSMETWWLSAVSGWGFWVAGSAGGVWMGVCNFTSSGRRGDGAGVTALASGWPTGSCRKSAGRRQHC